MKKNKIVRKGYVQCLDGDKALINTESDEIISVRFNDREQMMHFYCNHVKITMEIIDRAELD